MNGDKKIAVIAIVTVFVAFFGTLIHAELITDENRFLITDLAVLNQTILGQSFEYPSSPNFDVHFVEILPGAESGWHTHDMPLIATVLHGEITVYYCIEVSDRISEEIEHCPSGAIKRHFVAGDSFVEALNIEHNGKNEGFIPVKLHVVSLNTRT